MKAPLDSRQLTDAAVEVEVTLTSGCAGIWTRTGSEGYLLVVCKGYARLHALGNEPPSGANTLAEWSFDGPAPGTVVGLLVQGTTLSFYLGGELFGPVTDSRIKRGKVNAGALGAGAENGDVTFVDFRVFTPPAEPTRNPTTRQPSPTSSGWTSPSWSPSPSKKSATPSVQP